MTKCKGSETEKCGKGANYNYEGGKGKCCVDHKLEDMIYVTKRPIYDRLKAKLKYKKCAEDGCIVWPSYNYDNKKTGIYCVKHKKPNMVLVGIKTCQKIDCDHQPTYNYAGEKIGIYCSQHSLDNMVDVYNKKCIEEGCKTQPVFNFFGEKKGIYCVKHKKSKMVNVSHAKCRKEGCPTQPTFNFKGELKPITCSKHKDKGMINVVRKLCIENGCETCPTFNFKGEKKGIYCAKHKKLDMIIVGGKQCIFDGCSTTPCYNYKGEKGRIYCYEHKLENMINIKDKTCNEHDCPILPTFNYKGEKTGIYCNQHKIENMVDVTRKLCIGKNCIHRPSFGIPGNDAIYCREHIEDGMIYHPKTLCIENKCAQIAIYGIDKKQQHCEEHKKKGEINLIEHICNSCKLPNILNSKKLCYSCDPINGVKLRLGKQLQVKNYLDQNKLKYIESDKVINGGVCVKHRPDFTFDCTTHYIVLEIDEEQHKNTTNNCNCKFNKCIIENNNFDKDKYINYNHSCKCDFTRMIDISQALGMPTIFIRYNPDKFKLKDKDEDITFATRMKELGTYLKHYMKLDINEINKIGFLSIMYLYFDGYKKQTAIPKTILEFEQ